VCDLADGLDAREEAKDSEGPEAAQDADERDTACGGVRASPVTGSVHGQALRIKEQVQRLGHAWWGDPIDQGRAALESWSDSGRTMALASPPCSV
jgi:hypothetical protein